MGFCPVALCPVGLCPMGFCPVGFCPDTVCTDPIMGRGNKWRVHCCPHQAGQCRQGMNNSDGEKKYRNLLKKTNKAKV